MFLCLCVPFTAIDYALPIWAFPSWTCSMINYFQVRRDEQIRSLQHISAYFSVWTLTLMAADRFLAVCFPVDSMTLRNTTNTLVVMIVIYALILASQVMQIGGSAEWDLKIPVGLMHGIYDYDFIVEHRSSCAIVSIAKNEATVTQVVMMARGDFSRHEPTSSPSTYSVTFFPWASPASSIISC